MSCWRSSTTRPSTGSTCGPRTRSSRPSRPSGFAPGSPRAPGSRAAGVAMAFKLIESAQTRWRMVNAPHLVALVRAGALFINGKLVERPQDQDQQEVSKRRKTRRSTGLAYCSHPTALQVRKHLLRDDKSTVAGVQDPSKNDVLMPFSRLAISESLTGDDKAVAPCVGRARGFLGAAAANRGRRCARMLRGPR
jgi:hypothetical protein